MTEQGRYVWCNMLIEFRWILWGIGVQMLVDGKRVGWIFRGSRQPGEIFWTWFLERFHARSMRMGGEPLMCFTFPDGFHYHLDKCGMRIERLYEKNRSSAYLLIGEN